MDPGTVSVFAVVGLAKWIYDCLGKSAETDALVQKLQRLDRKYSKMDHRTNESKRIRDELVKAKTLIEANNAGAAGRVVDGALAVAGLS
jgi:hypothetical protein